MGLPFKNERKQKQLYIFNVQLAILVKALKFQIMGGLYTIKTLQVHTISTCSSCWLDTAMVNMRGAGSPKATKHQSQGRTWMIF
jgi:hypothetical protein